MAQGQLTVTATVVASVGVILGPDGEPHVIVANAAAPADGLAVLSRLPDTTPATASAASAGKSTKLRRNLLPNPVFPPPGFKK